MRTSSLSFASLLVLLLAPACGDSGGGSGPDGGGNKADSGGGGCTTDADNCCAPGANANTDPDCGAVCGNGAVEGVEQCDDGNNESGDGCDAQCMGEPTAYRIDTIALKDPHMFALGALDVTDQVNTQISMAMLDDIQPQDGRLDLSIVGVFRPVATNAASTPGEVVIAANCTPPAETTMCSADQMSQVIESTMTNMDTTCLEPQPGTTGGYTPAVETPGGRCFVSDKEDATVDAGGVVLHLTEAQLSGTYDVGTPPGSISTGLFVGFMSQADADTTLLPANIPFVGGQPISSLLKSSDMDTNADGVQGWYFYFNYTALQVPWSE